VETRLRPERHRPAWPAGGSRRVVGSVGADQDAPRALSAGAPESSVVLAYAYSPESVEGESSEVREDPLSSLCLSAPCACPPSPTPGWREVTG
jgi:hypothetical protein